MLLEVVLGERRDTAFSLMENVAVSDHGFYATSCRSYVLGQFEGEVGDSDCVLCKLLFIEF